jgi:hypothetical protein
MKIWQITDAHYGSVSTAHLASKHWFVPFDVVHVGGDTRHKA